MLVGHLSEVVMLIVGDLYYRSYLFVVIARHLSFGLLLCCCGGIIWSVKDASAGFWERSIIIRRTEEEEIQHPFQSQSSLVDSNITYTLIIIKNGCTEQIRDIQVALVVRKRSGMFMGFSHVDLLLVNVIVAWVLWRSTKKRGTHTPTVNLRHRPASSCLSSTINSITEERIETAGLDLFTV